jgi:hypothetical protein
MNQLEHINSVHNDNRVVIILIHILKKIEL